MEKSNRVEQREIDRFIDAMKYQWSEDPYPSGLYVTNDRLYVWYAGDNGTTFLCDKEYFEHRARELLIAKDKQRDSKAN